MTRTAGYRLLFRVSPVALIIAGIVLRIAMARAAGSLAMDDLMLSVNLLTRSSAGLLKTLDLQQVAAPLFLQLQHAIVRALGMSDVHVRLVPFLSGACCLPAVYLCCERLALPRRASLLALGAASASPMLVTFSTTTKPYSSDALITALLVLVTARWMSDRTSRAWVAVAVVGTVVLTFSLSAVFVLTGIGAAAFYERARFRRGLSWGALLATGAGWVALFGIIHRTFYRVASQDPGMRRFWRGSYLADRFDVANPIGGLKEIGVGLGSAFDSVALPSPGFSAVTIVVLSVFLSSGIWWLEQRGRRTTLVLLVTPILATMAASVLRQYIFMSRLVLFLAPLLCILVALGACQLSTVVPRRVRTFVFGMLGLVVLVPLVRTDVYLLRHRYWSHGEGSLAREVLASSDTSTVVYVPGVAMPAWVVYSNDWHHPDTSGTNFQVGVIRALGFNSGNMGRRPAPIVSEGDSFRRSAGDRVELYGISTGVASNDGGRATSQPDPGWARNEVRRIVATGRTQLWIYTGDIPVPPSLFGALDSVGAQRVSADTVGASFLYRYRLPR